MTIPVADQDNSIVERDGVIDFSRISDRELQETQAKNRKAIQIREIETGWCDRVGPAI